MLAAVATLSFAAILAQCTSCALSVLQPYLTAARVSFGCSNQPEQPRSSIYVQSLTEPAHLWFVLLRLSVSTLLQAHPNNPKMVPFRNCKITRLFQVWSLPACLPGSCVLRVMRSCWGSEWWIGGGSEWWIGGGSEWWTLYGSVEHTNRVRHAGSERGSMQAMREAACRQ